MRLADQLLQLAPERSKSDAWVERNSDATLARTWTWLDTKIATASVSSFLLDHGVASGDRIVNFGCNSFEWALLDLACSTINAIHVPMDTRMSSNQRARCVEQIEPTLVFSDEPLTSQLGLGQLSVLPHSRRKLEQIVQPYRPENVANVLFTSGTTGAPRGVMLSHHNLVSNAKAKLDAMPQSSSDHRLNFLPFSHAYARTCELSAWLMSYSSMEVVSGIEGALSTASSINPTLINGVPLFFERLCESWASRGGSKSALASILGNQIRQLASGGAAIPDAIRSKLAEVHLPVHQGYGLTETSPVVCSNRASRPHTSLNHILAVHDFPAPNFVGVGPPVQGVRVRIDEASKLWVSGDGVMLGYWKDPEATQAKIVDGWLDTGDLAEYAESQGSNNAAPAIRIIGRADDTIVLSNGYKIAPLPIEQTINAQPWVASCMLFGNGSPFSILVLRQKESVPVRKVEDLLSDVQSLLKSFPRYSIPRRILLTREPWTIENGMANFKGGFIRHRIEAQHSDRLREAYHQPQ
jgi:long-chain acyl-CoA synthetase